MGAAVLNSLGSLFGSVRNPTVDYQGVVGGGHVGYDYELFKPRRDSGPFGGSGGGFVVGIEGDVNGASITGDGIDGTGLYFRRERTQVDASIRGRPWLSLRSCACLRHRRRGIRVDPAQRYGLYRV